MFQNGKAEERFASQEYLTAQYICPVFLGASSSQAVGTGHAQLVRQFLSITNTYKGSKFHSY